MVYFLYYTCHGLVQDCISTVFAIVTQHSCSFHIMEPILKAHYYETLLHWNQKVVTLMTFSSLAAPKLVRMTTWSAASDEKLSIWWPFAFIVWPILTVFFNRLTRPYFISISFKFVILPMGWIDPSLSLTLTWFQSTVSCRPIMTSWAGCRAAVTVIITGSQGQGKPNVGIIGC